MDLKLLMCDDTVLGKLIKQTIDNYRFTTVLCRNTIEIVENELEKDRYDAVLMFVEEDSEEYYSLIRRTLEKYPGIKVFASLGIDSEKLKKEVCKAGVSRYMVMPIHAADVCELLTEEFTPFKDKLIIDEIDRFLLTKRFARHIPGYIFLCIAVENCLENPRLLSALDEKLYPYIAEITLTTPEYVKKTIQRLADNAIRRGFTFFSYKSGARLNDREILAACADEFATRHLKHLYKTTPPSLTKDSIPDPT